MLAAALSLGSSCALGLGDFLGGMLARRRPLLLVVIVSQIVGGALALLVAVCAGGAAPAGTDALAAVGCGVALLAGVTLLYRALAIGTMGVIAPIVALGAIVPVTVGLLSGEAPSAVQLAAMVVCGIGVALSTARKGPHTGSGLGTALGALLAVGTVYTTLDVAAAGAAVWAVAIVRSTSAVLALALFAPALLRSGVGAGELRAAARDPYVSLIGVLEVAGMLAFAIASTRGLLSVVAVLSSLYPAVTVLLARVLLCERLTRLQLAGAAATLAGATSLAAG